MSKATFSELERLVLGTVQLQADLSVEELSSVLETPAHRIRYCIQQLKRRSILLRRPMTDVHLLGFTQYSIFFKPHFQSRSARSALLRALIESDKTSDIFELGGDYQYGAVLTVRDIQEVAVFLAELARIRGVEIVDKTLSTRVSTTLFRRSYLGPPKLGPSHITYRRSERREVISAGDHKLLNAMHVYPELSRRELGRKLGIPHSTITARINDLLTRGVLLGWVYGIATQHFGMEAYRLVVQTKGFDLDQWRKLFTLGAKHPHILCLFQCIGAWDYEFEVEVEHRQQISDVAQEVYELLGNAVVSIKTLPLFSFPKSSGYPYSHQFNAHAAAEYRQ